jgi:redox-sensitive bicupin YhaK (pirin superfamily)
MEFFMTNINIIRAHERGRSRLGWLDSYHSFSFGEYYNARRMGFGPLRVINDDIVSGGSGFGTHPHRDMEIVSIPLRGALAHKDSMGHTETIVVDEVQAMTAGSGITHSEFNPSAHDEVNFLQIWLLPRKTGLPPAYGQKKFAREDAQKAWQILVDGVSNNGALRINQDARIARRFVTAGEKIDYRLAAPQRGLYLMLIEGAVAVAEEELDRRDALELSGGSEISITAREDSYLLAIDVPLP